MKKLRKAKKLSIGSIKGHPRTKPRIGPAETLSRNAKKRVISRGHKVYKELAPS